MFKKDKIIFVCGYKIIFCVEEVEYIEVLGVNIGFLMGNSLKLWVLKKGDFFDFLSNFLSA